MESKEQRTVFVGKFQHAVDEKKRVAVPAKWRAAASGTREFYVMPDPSGRHLVVLTEDVMAKWLDRADDISIGQYEQRDVLRRLTSKAFAAPCDKQGRIMLTEESMRDAGIVGQAVLVGMLSKFEIWSPERLAATEQGATQTLAEAAKQLGL